MARRGTRTARWSVDRGARCCGPPRPARGLPVVIDLGGLGSWPSLAQPFLRVQLDREGLPSGGATAEAFTALVAAYERKALTALDDLVATDGVDPRRVYLAGFSYGGDLSWAIAQRNPSRFGGALTAGSRNSHPVARRGLSAQHRFVMLMGTEDAPDRQNGARMAAQALARLEVTGWFCDMPGVGHAPDAEVVAQALGLLLAEKPSTAQPPCRAL